ncbi:resuscitation-promoting factor [Sediminihabitans luteus]|uniref:resuscitation-promoting factor n=1 Tax=Sediminihabitans luteus TaxID=1138585 RepID=UPI001EF252B7|nr:resuscitation-promoting factor [Sediminihabitans luteus]
MTGPTDDWNRVNDNLDGAPESTAPMTQPIDLAAAPGTVETPATTRRRRRWPFVAGATAVAVVAAGSVAYADARKTVTLDVDGETRTVTTFAGSVDGLLDEQGVAVGSRDEVQPAVDTALAEGGDVVVRSGHQITVQADGDDEQLWTNALDADEALASLENRGDDVSLVASRSDERTALPLVLDVDGPVNLVHDGTTVVVPDGHAGVEAILADNEVTVGDLDRVSVVRDDTQTPAVSLVVQRVTVKEESSTKSVDYDTTTVTDSDRYADLGTAVKAEGKKGVYTTVNKVTRVDGKVESTELVSKGVTTEPVDRVLVKGTKERPVATPKPTTSSSSSSSSKSSSSSSSSSGSSSSSKATGSAPAGVWASLAQCESGGNPATNTGNGYYGLYQFSAQTWRAMGGSGLPSENSAAEQTRLAQKLQAQSGWGQWPACARKLGLL